jgi:hypothetical protein
MSWTTALLVLASIVTAAIIFAAIRLLLRAPETTSNDSAADELVLSINQLTSTLRDARAADLRARVGAQGDQAGLEFVMQLRQISDVLSGLGEQAGAHATQLQARAAEDRSIFGRALADYSAQLRSVVSAIQEQNRIAEEQREHLARLAEQTSRQQRALEEHVSLMSRVFRVDPAP